jgi:uncharacterized protein
MCSVYAFPLHALSDEPKTWEEVRFGGIVEQGLDNSCGFASLLTIMRTHFGDERYDERTLLQIYMENSNEVAIAEAMRNGLSLLELEHLAQSLGYDTKKKILSFDDLERLVSFVPVLVYLEAGKFRHFAVVRGIHNNTVLLGDPSRGNVEYSRDAFLSEWKTVKEHPDTSGLALVIVKREGIFAQKLLKQPKWDDPPSFIEIRRQMIQ